MFHNTLHSASALYLVAFQTKFKFETCCKIKGCKSTWKLREVGVFNEMDPLCVSLVHQYLDSTKSALADQFKTIYQPKKTNVNLKEVLSKWSEEQLARNIVYQHLRSVAPSLALEFKEAQCCSLENVPKQLLKLVEASQRKSQEKDETRKVFTVHKVDENKCAVNKNPKEAGGKAYTFTPKEVARIEIAIANKEDTRTLAKEMGRTYRSVSKKLGLIGADFKTGKFSVEENLKIKQALAKNEDYKKVAKELCRDPRTVQTRMLFLKCNPRQQQGKKKREYSLEEDLLILEKVIPRLKFQKLSSTGFISQSDAMELATELHRNFKCVGLRWERFMQRWLLQHYTGTSGFKVEGMLTRLVAQNYKDYRGIDWSRMMNQHKEFTGHTRASICQLYHACLQAARKLKKTDAVSLEEVAECTAVYQVRKESVGKIARREKIVEHFKKRVDELGIDIVL